MWQLNPDFALQSRLSFGRGARYAWALTACALFVGFDGFAREVRPGVALLRAGGFLLLGALPYGAIQVRALERDGQLDARRLTGRAPVALAAALVGGSAWALLVPAVAFLAAAAAAGETLAPLTVTALLALGTAMSLVLLLMPGPRLESWMLFALLAVGVVATVSSIRTGRGIAVGVLAVSLAIMPWGFPMAFRRLRGAAPAANGPTASPLRDVVPLHRATYPEFARGLLSGGQSLSTAALMALAAAASVWWLTRTLHATARDIYEVLAVYGPLLLAGYATAAHVRYEYLTGGLDRIRLSGQSAWTVVLQFASALSLPFVAVSLVAAATLAIVDPTNAPNLLRPWPVTAALVILVPMMGTLQGKKPGAFIALGMLLAAWVSARDVDRGVGAVAIATVFGLAAASLERGVRGTPEPGGAAARTAGIAAVVAATVHPKLGGPLVAAIIAVSAGLVFSGRTRIAPRTIALCGAAAALAAGAGDILWGAGRFTLGVREFTMAFGRVYMPEPGSRLAHSGIVAVAAGLGMVFGCYALNRAYGRTLSGLALRAAPLAAFAGIFTYAPWLVAFEDRFMERFGYNLEGVVDVVFLFALAVTTMFLAWRTRESVTAPPPPA